MASKAMQNLERPVNFTTAAKKLAKIRGDYGVGGGWIRNKYGKIVCQGWDNYGQKMFKSGLLVQDAKHNGGNGKWYVWALGLTEEELRTAERLFGENLRAEVSA